MACVSRGLGWGRWPRADVDAGGELSDNLRDYVRKRAEDIWIFKTLISGYIEDFEGVQGKTWAHGIFTRFPYCGIWRIITDEEG